jgi:hypothetical protein
MLKLYHYTLLRRVGNEWSASRLGRALAPGKGPPVPIVQEAGWAPEQVWTQRLDEKSSRLCQGSNLDCPVVQPVARHYTDWATRLTPQWCSYFYFRASLIESKGWCRRQSIARLGRKEIRPWIITAWTLCRWPRNSTLHNALRRPREYVCVSSHTEIRTACEGFRIFEIFLLSFES